MAAPRGATRVGLTRERILAESARVFNRRGYHGTTLDDIAQALHVTKAALYYHVKSKEEVLFLCHLRSLEIAKEGLDLARARSADVAERLRIALRHYVQRMTDQLTASVALLEDGAISPSLQRRLIEKRDAYERELRALIEAGIADGTFRPCSTKLVGFAILGAVNWIPKWFDPAGPCSGAEVADIFADYLVRGMLARPASGANGNGRTPSRRGRP
jgi:TetR/AcrR family transcriptional regulator